MIATHIYTKNIKVAEMISLELFKRNLIQKASIIENTSNIMYSNNVIESQNLTLLITLGKAIHSSEIKLILSQLLPNENPFYYSLPILNYCE